MKIFKEKKKFILVLLGLGVLLVLSIFLFAESSSVGRQNKEDEERRARLEELLNEEKKREIELMDAEAYVQTRKYIEEKAKSIGYVYPDEIIFREDE